jgi:hypothetical protein
MAPIVCPLPLGIANLVTRAVGYSLAEGLNRLVLEGNVDQRCDQGDVDLGQQRAAVMLDVTVPREHMDGDLGVDPVPVDVRHSDFDLDEGTAVTVTNGTLTLENNVIVSHDHDGTGLRLDNAGAASVVRYNTLVAPMSKLISASIAVTCTGASPVVTSNIIAWRSTAPIGAGSTCELRNSLFDLEAGGLPPGSAQQDIDAIFNDTGSGDYRPAAASMARGMSEPDLDILDDHDGIARPQPTGSAPDIGAYEVP